MEENQSLFELEIDRITAEELIDTSRWQKLYGIILLSILGLVLLAFLIAFDKIEALIAEAMATTEGQGAMIMVVIILLVAVAIFGVMCFFLIRGAGRIRSALRLKDQLLFNNGLSDLKIFFIIYGVISILSLLGNLGSFL